MTTQSLTPAERDLLQFLADALAEDLADEIDPQLAGFRVPDDAKLVDLQSLVTRDLIEDSRNTGRLQYRITESGQALLEVAPPLDSFAVGDRVSYPDRASEREVTRYGRIVSVSDKLPMRYEVSGLGRKAWVDENKLTKLPTLEGTVDGCWTITLRKLFELTHGEQIRNHYVVMLGVGRVRSVVEAAKGNIRAEVKGVESPYAATSEVIIAPLNNPDAMSVLTDNVMLHNADAHKMIDNAHAEASADQQEIIDEQAVKITTLEKRLAEKTEELQVARAEKLVAASGELMEARAEIERLRALITQSVPEAKPTNTVTIRTIIQDKLDQPEMRKQADAEIAQYLADGWTILNWHTNGTLNRVVVLRCDNGSPKARQPLTTTTDVDYGRGAAADLSPVLITPTTDPATAPQNRVARTTAQIISEQLSGHITRDEATAELNSNLMTAGERAARRRTRRAYPLNEV